MAEKKSLFTIRKTTDGNYALRLRGELLGVFANRKTAEKYQQIEKRARGIKGNPVSVPHNKWVKGSIMVTRTGQIKFRKASSR